MGIVYMVDGVRCCGKAFFVECTGDEAGYATPVAFWLWKYGASANRCTLSVVLLSTVPAFARTGHMHSWCEWIQMLFVWF